MLRSRQSTTVLLAWLLSVGTAAATDPQTPAAQVEQDADRVRAAHAENRGGEPSFVVLPIPQVSPALGSGLAVVGVAFYQPKGSARPWMTGAGSMYTDNKSRAAGAFHKAYLDGDRFRITAMGGVADLHLDFYGIGGKAGDRTRSIPMQQKGNAVVFDGLMRVADDLYLGLRLRSLKVDTTFNLRESAHADLIPSQVELDSRVAGPGLLMEYDTRDSEQNPRSGWYAKLQALWALDGFGSDFDYDSQKLAVNVYRSIGGNHDHVLALRGSLCRTGDGAPFFGLCMFGSENDLRGYEAGRFRDRAMLATQAEYRRRLHGRWGMVAFAGIGGVASAFGELGDEAWLPAGGVGVRFQASKTYDVNVRVDYAVGKGGEDALYVYIGEAF